MRTLVDRLEPGELIPNGPFSYYGGRPEPVIIHMYIKKKHFAVKSLWGFSIFYKSLFCSFFFALLLFLIFPPFSFFQTLVMYIICFLNKMSLGPFYLTSSAEAFNKK